MVNGVYQEVANVLDCCAGRDKEKQLADIISKQLISVLMLQERPSSLAKKSYLGRTNHHTSGEQFTGFS